MALFVIATPIGHFDDITLRASHILRSCELWVVEETKPARQLAKSLGVFKEMIQLNEHNEQESAQEVIEILKTGQDIALISDCGTPGFADPGAQLVDLCHHLGLDVIPVPGASSLMAALSVSGLGLKEFFYAGFLPRKAEERRKAVRRWKPLKCPVVVYEAPYRLKALLDDLMLELPHDRGIRLFAALTQPEERIFVGTLAELDQWLQKEPIKLEFVLIVEPAPVKVTPVVRSRARKRRRH